MGVVETRDLTKIYRTGMRKGDIVALDNVTIEVSPGEIFGLLGPNGAGKTTLFKVLLGIAHATAGSATLNGFSPGDPRSRERVGFLPENHRFPQHLTGLGLLELTGCMYGMSRSDIATRSSELLKLVGMDRWGGTNVRKFSKGMLQRIGLAQALIADPDLLFLDEPTDGVDPVGRIEIREILKKIRDTGKTIVLNSHLLAEVESVADRVAILQKGRLLKVSSVELLTTRQSQYEIEADLGSKLIDLPEEIGKVLALTSKGMLVELTEPERVNDVIDRLRMKRISIRAVKPVRISLEESFLQAVSEEPEEES